MTVVHTIGHSNHLLEHFIELLRRHRIATIADVRSRPYSRRAPHFQKSALRRSLGAERLAYVFLGQELGGRPVGVEFYSAAGHIDYERRAHALEFQAGIERLIELAGRTSTAILCAEEDPARCHRSLLVAPALERRGIAVLHIRGDGRIQSADELREPSSQLRLFAELDDRSTVELAAPAHVAEGPDARPSGTDAPHPSGTSASTSAAEIPDAMAD